MGRWRFVPEIFRVHSHTLSRKLILKAVFCVVLMLSNQVSRESFSEASNERQVSGPRATRTSCRKRPQPFLSCLLCVSTSKIKPTDSGAGGGGRKIRGLSAAQPSIPQHGPGGASGAPLRELPLPGEVSGAPGATSASRAKQPHAILLWQKPHLCVITGDSDVSEVLTL